MFLKIDHFIVTRYVNNFKVVVINLVRKKGLL